MESLRSLDPLDQFSEEIGDKKRIGKDECPCGDPVQVDLDSPRFQILFANRLFFSKAKSRCPVHLPPPLSLSILTSSFSLMLHFQSSMLLLTTLKNTIPTMTISPMTTKFIVANSLTTGLIQCPFLTLSLISLSKSCAKPFNPGKIFINYYN